MEFLLKCWDLVRHLDVHLETLVSNYQLATYLILAGIVFCETGLVITPFLPGDSLLFAAGAVTAKANILDVRLLMLILMAATFLGDNFNYFLGNRIGKKVFERDFWLIKKSYLIRTQEFYDRHGGKTILLARFLPILRTFAPFVAGVGAMRYRRFIGFSLFSSALWVTLFTLAGYFFGQLQFVKNNFEWIVAAIIAISVMPLVFEWWRHRKTRRRKQGALRNV